MVRVLKLVLAQTEDTCKALATSSMACGHGMAATIATDGDEHHGKGKGACKSFGDDGTGDNSDGDNNDKCQHNRDHAVYQRAGLLRAVESLACE